MNNVYDFDNKYKYENENLAINRSETNLLYTAEIHNSVKIGLENRFKFLTSIVTTYNVLCIPFSSFLKQRKICMGELSSKIVC